MYRIRNGYSFYSNGGISLRWDLEGRVFGSRDEIAHHLVLFENVRGRVPDDWVIETLVPASVEEQSARDLLEEFLQAQEGEGE